jgi:hypothetical protein
MSKLEETTELSFAIIELEMVKADETISSVFDRMNKSFKIS